MAETDQREKNWYDEPLPTLPSPPFDIPPDVPLSLTSTNALRIRGTRVGLEIVTHQYDEGFSAEEIVANFPTLRLPSVYRVLAFYLENREIIRKWLQAQDDLMESWAERSGLKALTQKRTQEFRERLAKRQAATG